MDTKPWSGFRAWLYSLIFRSPKSNRLLIDWAEPTASDRVLDIGCGPGAAVRLAADIVAEGEAVGVDRSGPMIDIARRRSADYQNVRFEVGSAESLPFSDDAFTLVLTAHSFHHWEDRRAGLAEIRRVLVGGGRLLILEQDGKKHGLADSQTEVVVADLERLGFQDVSTQKVDNQVLISGSCELGDHPS